MAITKSKDMNWKSYIRALAESPAKLSDIEKVEMSGYLLRRDIERDGGKAILGKIFSQDNYVIGDFIANFLITESPDSIQDMLQIMKQLAKDHYEPHINILLADELEMIKEEQKADKQNPNDEYDPNVDSVLNTCLTTGVISS